MLGRKATRIDLKPEDREEYFAHKQARKEGSSEQAKPEDKATDKGARIGLSKTR